MAATECPLHRGGGAAILPCPSPPARNDPLPEVLMPEVSVPDPRDTLISIAQTGPESGAPLLSCEALLAPLRPRFAFIIATLLMTLLLLVQTQSQIPFFAEFQKDSEYILPGSIPASRDLGFDFVGGFMTSPDPLVHRAAVTRIEPGLADRQYLPYISDSGLQYKILWLFAPPSA